MARLLLGLLSLLFATAVLSVDPSCGPGSGYNDYARQPWYPTPDPMPAVSKWMGGLEYNATLCSWAFWEHEWSFSNWNTCCYVPRANVHTCPHDCLRAVKEGKAAVYGSFPYHANSSICVAAIHAGLISNWEGGGVFLSRFFPADWSNSSTQTLFPVGSERSTTSNGVTTTAVPAEWRPTPAPLSSYSWTLKARGVVANQRQTAPFSPRAGHALVNIRRVWTSIPFDGERSAENSHVAPGIYWDHLIIGGMNSTHYMNDVWSFHILHILSPTLH